MTGEHWQDALAEVERGVRDCLAALDRYEATFEGVLTPEPAPKPTGGWEETLHTAEEQTNRVEQLLAEQESAWTRWHAALTKWEQSASPKT
jgi:hypothetical protein